MSTLVLLLLATAMFINYKNAESFIRDQLLSNAENTASTLGVAIARVKGDKAMSETLINAVFDSGYYEVVVLSDINGNVVYQKREPVKVQGVPPWFIDHVHLESSEAVVPLSSDWKLIGYLKISGHRGHAYEQLWQAFMEMVIGFVSLGVVALAGIYLLLKIVLLPLKRVREQAEAVIQRRFIFQKQLPKTKEMRDVVMAMNSLVKKVKMVYEKEAKAVSDYKRLLYEDRETGYYNRAYFRIKLQEYLHSSDYFSHGYVLAFEIHNYAKLLEENGVNSVHKAMMKLRDIIDAHCCTSFVEAVRCRTRESDIMIILPASRREQVDELAHAVYEACREGCQVDCAYISYEEGDSLTKIMERVDSGLMVAAAIEADSIRIYSDGKDDIPLLSHDEWRQNIQQAIENNAFIPMLQPVVNHDGETVQNELLLRLEYEGKIVSVGLFLPMIAAVKMMSVFDRYVLELLDTLPLSKPIAVNITHDFILHSANLQVISSLAERWKREGMDIIFELPNATVASDPEASKAFASHIHREGWKLGIDHFTVGDYDLRLLEELKPAYLKINAAYLLSLVEGSEEELSKSSLLTLTELLEIDLIAIGVDSEEIATRLKENSILLMQGFWVGEPKEGGEI
jgi:EAL domain-containing protein (putative c-di-GMP-specific phosphodiesterase class I)